MTELWGASGPPALALPGQWIGYLSLAIVSLLLLLLLYSYRRSAVGRFRHDWAATLILALASLLLSQLFLIGTPLPGIFTFLPTEDAPNFTQPLAASIPLLMAAALLNPVSAAIVGFSAGLGSALWQTHSLLQPLLLALIGVLATPLLQQRYEGRIFAILRQPIVAGGLSHSVVAPLIVLLTLLANLLGSNVWQAFDMAIYVVSRQGILLIISGLFGGLVCTVILPRLPRWREGRQPLSPAPGSKHLNQRLLLNFALVALPVTTLILLAILIVNYQSATSRILEGLDREAVRMAEQVEGYQRLYREVLWQHRYTSRLVEAKEEQISTKLGRLFANQPHFEQILVVKDNGEVYGHHPDIGDQISLNEAESEAVNAVLKGEKAEAITVDAGEDDGIVSFVTPIFSEEDLVIGALIGRTALSQLEELVTSPQVENIVGSGFIVDQAAQVVIGSNSERLGKGAERALNRSSLVQNAENSEDRSFRVFEGEDPGMSLISWQGDEDSPWAVVMRLPHDVILRQALDNGLPIAGAMVATMTLFAVTLMAVGRSVTRPVNQLLGVSESIAGGSLDTPVQPLGHDELGQLGRAFEFMQRSLRQRLDELSLLVNVSQEVSTTLDVEKGLPAILQGAIRGTGASGARFIALNPVARRPLTFAEGPDGDGLAQYDRQVMAEVRRQQEVVLATPESIREVLGDEFLTPTIGVPPVRALVAIGLTSKDRFQGMFWLAFRRPHRFDQIEMSLVRTLANQASVLMANAQLYIKASSGRRRLLAVLASTADAVIVTDQTATILLVNPAMERAYKVRFHEVAGRQVSDIIKSETLLRALGAAPARKQSLETRAPDGRTYHVNVAPISSDGQSLGRVAVLHDITRLKEIDEMKSDIVATVSHDLRGPLAYMRGFATMLADAGNLTDDQHLFAEKIVTGIDEMSALVHDLLDLSRLESGSPLAIGIVHVGSVLEQIAAKHQEQALAAGLRIKVDYPPELPSIPADSTRLRQALTNLVGNAIKYAPNSGPLLLNAYAGRDEVVLRVHDRGPGIAEEDQAQLFDKFYRVRSRGNSGVKGTGLGLAIVKSIAEQHGGRAWVRSQPGQGSTFFLALPLKPLVQN